MTPAWPHGDPRDVVRAIVADPRFIPHSRKPPVRRWWLDDVRDWIARLLREIFHTLDHALGARNALDSVIGVVVIASAFALLGYCVYVLVRSYGRAPRARSGGPRVESLPGVERSSAQLRIAAVGAARAGRHRDAAALLFLAAARALDECGRVAYDPARTPGEYRRIVRDPLFDAFAADAVVALFAAAEPRDELFDRMTGSYDRLFDTARR